MSAIGCYTLDLYCDKLGKWPDGVHEFGEFPHQYNHELGSNCRRRARRAGWLLGRHGSAICPKCAGKKRDSLIPASALSVQPKEADHGH